MRAQLRLRHLLRPVIHPARLCSLPLLPPAGLGAPWGKGMWMHSGTCFGPQ